MGDGKKILGHRRGCREKNARVLKWMTYEGYLSTEMDDSRELVDTGKDDAREILKHRNSDAENLLGHGNELHSKVSGNNTEGRKKEAQHRNE